MVEAALELHVVAAAERLRPEVAEYSGLSLVAGQFTALFGSADRYLGATDSVLGDTAADELHELAERTRDVAEPLGLVRPLGAVGDARAGIPRQRADGLTPRETQVLRLLGEGLLNREIADRLVISEHTAANHVRSILAKTGSSNRTQTAVYASEHELLQ